MHQFDIVMQKQNLTPHQQVHPAMYMPSHGEFLVELLVRNGFQSGLMFGLDDFAEAGGLLNRSDAEVLIVCGADQHFRTDFAQGWSQVRRRHPCRVLVVSEPIFSPLAFYLDAQRNAARQHLDFIARFEPQIVLYLSRYDQIEASRRLGSAIDCLLYSLADPSLLSTPLIPWEHKRQGLLFLGKREAWAYAQAPAGALLREQQFDLFLQQQRMFFGSSLNKFSFRQCYDIANQFRFQLQLRSGYAFHTARTVQSAIVGCIPVLLLHRDELPLLHIEAPFAEADGNLLVACEDTLEPLFDKLEDEALCRRIHARLGELLAGGTIAEGVSQLAAALHRRLAA